MSNRLSELANKLFKVKPNEQVIKIIKGDLQIPTHDIPNLFTNLRELSRHNDINKKESLEVIKFPNNKNKND